MFRTILLLAVCAACGCSHSHYDIADPVIGPAPPRTPGARTNQAEISEPREIRTVSFEGTEPLTDTAVVARVNGTPVLASEILDLFASKLAQVRAQATDAQYRQLQEQCIKKTLPDLIDQTLMVDAVKSRLKKDALQSVEAQLDVHFAKKVEELKKQFQVNSVAELEAVLRAQGMSLETMRRMTFNRELASNYVQMKIGPDAPVTRTQILERYQAHLEDYARPEKVKWQQLQISFASHGGEDGARESLAQAQAELRDGRDFGEVVKTYSDGAFQEVGGAWDWTQPESIANPEIRTALDTMPVGEVSQPVFTSTMVQIVKVTERQEAGYRPFEDEDLQKELIGEIKSERRVEKAKQIVADLRASAIIETMFDMPESAQTAAFELEP